MTGKEIGRKINNEEYISEQFQEVFSFLPPDWLTDRWEKKRIVLDEDIFTKESYRIWQRPEYNVISYIDYDPGKQSLSATAITVFETWEENASQFRELFRDPKNVTKIPVGLWRVMKQAGLTLSLSGNPVGLRINNEIGIVSRNKSFNGEVRVNPYFGTKIAAWHKDRYEIRNIFKKPGWTVTATEPVAVPA